VKVHNIDRTVRRAKVRYVGQCLELWDLEEMRLEIHRNCAGLD
jgi:hypothetical protein